MLFSLINEKLGPENFEWLVILWPLSAYAKLTQKSPCLNTIFKPSLLVLSTLSKQQRLKFTITAFYLKSLALHNINWYAKHTPEASHFNTFQYNVTGELSVKFSNYNIQFLKARTPAVGFRSMAEETGRLWRSSLVRRLITNMRGPRRTGYKELRWAAWQPWRWLWRRGKLGRGRWYINGMMVWMPYSVILKATRTHGNQKLNTKTPFTRA